MQGYANTLAFHLSLHTLPPSLPSLPLPPSLQLGLSGEDEVSLQRLLKGLQTEVIAALEELTVITTYDDNLECQYKEG